MYKAIQEIQTAFDKHNLKYTTKQLGDKWVLQLKMGGKKGEYEFLFIKSDDSGNDVALRIFRVENFSPANRAKGFALVTELQNKYRYIRFAIDDDGDLNVSYDFPLMIEGIGDAALEMMLRITQILDESRPALVRASWD